VDGRDVDVVVDGYLFRSFVLNSLLGGLSNDFGAVSVVQLAVTANYLT
jgi:hypothetical protein